MTHPALALDSLSATSPTTTAMTRSGARRTLRALASDEATVPLAPVDLAGTDFWPSSPSGSAGGEGATHRYAAVDAELRVRGRHRHLAVGLRDAHGQLLMLVMWAQMPMGRIRVGKYRIATPGEESQVDEQVMVTAYLTGGAEWRCLGATRAVAGRIALTTLHRDKAQGAFDVMFPHLRVHGTFLARRASTVQDDNA